MSKRVPAFRFYPDDFVAGIVDMTTEEVGSYVLLLCYQWNKGYIPNDEIYLRRICRVNEDFFLENILKKFSKKYSKSSENIIGLQNSRLEVERKKQEKYSQVQAIKGKKGGRGHKARALPNENQKKAKRKLNVSPDKASVSVSVSVSDSDSSSVTDSVSDSNTTTGVGVFDEFWKVYPKKRDKKNALKAWNRLKPSETLAMQIIEAVNKERLSDQWAKENGQFIPLPSTFLNGERWQDGGVDVLPTQNRAATQFERIMQSQQREVKHVN